MVFKVKSLVNLGMYIACFIAFTFYGVDYFIPGLADNTKVYSLCGIIIISCSILSILKSGLKKIRLVDLMVFFLLILPLLWNNRDLGAREFTRPLQYLWIAFLYLAYRSSNMEDWIGKFLKIIMFVGVFYAFFTVMSFVSQDFYFNIIYPKLSTISVTEAARLTAYYESGYMSGITAHYSTNGIYIGLGIIPFFVCAVLEKAYFPKKHLPIVFVFLLILLALALTGKRAHLIFTIIALIIVVYYYYSDQQYSRIIKIIFFMALSVVVAYIVSLFIPQVMNAYNRILQGLEENNLDNGRNVLSTYALLAFSSEKVLGHGWSWFSQYNIISPGDHAHNTYYQLLCETGIVGFALYFGFLVTMLIRAIKLLKRICKIKPNYRSQDRVIVCCAVAYELFFLMYMVTGNPLYEFSCYMPLFLFIGAVETVNSRIRRDEVKMAQEVRF